MTYRFKKGELAAYRDKATLTDWERGTITTAAATKAIQQNNDRKLTVPEFLQMAAGLGYIREADHGTDPER